MPFTPFHLGPAILLYSLFPRLNPWAIIFGSVVVDIEPFLVLLFDLDCRLHGLSHTFLAAGLSSGLLSLIFSRLFKDSVLLSSTSLFLGYAVHVLLDSILYSDITPFYPLTANPVLGLVSLPVVYLFCLFCLPASYLIHKKN